VDSKRLGSDRDQFVSRIFFDLEVDGELYEQLHVDVRQAVGTSFEDAPLEVSRPAGYEGPLDLPAFRAEVEAYYRPRVRRSGYGLAVAAATPIRLFDHIVEERATTEFEIPARSHEGEDS
jgi:hypothetical protein